MTYLAAYGTLRKYDNEKGKVRGYRLVVPGNFSFPAAIPYKDEEITRRMGNTRLGCMLQATQWYNIQIHSRKCPIMTGNA